MNRKIKEVGIVYGCTSEDLEEEYYVVGSGAHGCDKIKLYDHGQNHFVEVIRKDQVIRLYNPTRIIFEVE